MAGRSGLAGRGWQVTGVDVSATALQCLRDRATETGLSARIATERHDLASTFPAGAFDLVCACYLHSPIDIPRITILQRAAAAVAPGGMLLVMEHASLAPWSWKQDKEPHFPPPEETAAALELASGQWHAARIGRADRVATGPDGQQATVTDAVIALQRRTS